jgi:hypothetical protein
LRWKKLAPGQALLGSNCLAVVILQLSGKMKGHATHQMPHQLD